VPRPAAARFASRSLAERNREKLPRRRRSTTKNNVCAEVPMECAFLRRVLLQCCGENARIDLRLRALSQV